MQFCPKEDIYFRYMGDITPQSVVISHDILNEWYLIRSMWKYLVIKTYIYVYHTKSGHKFQGLGF